MAKQMTWQELPIGGLIVQPGNSVAYPTGEWRSHRPVIDFDLCTHCMICWLYCPDVSILVEDEKMVGFDYVHCKGCGICTEVCPVHAIHQEEESKFT
ncbi:MAG: 4Fe-4S binding protein [Chloroflexi bacterium]|nr:4Fe-4S binding protein [Chloroflexota bacterium]